MAQVTERAQENINLLHEKLIDETRISARKNGLNISMSTFNRITHKTKSEMVSL